MKVANLVELLAAYVELLRDTRAKSQADAMQALGDALRTSASLQVKAAAERLMVGAEAIEEAGDALTVAVALSSLRTLHKVLVAAGSKSATDLQLMTDALATMATRPVTAIAASLAPKPKPVKTAKAKALDPAAIRALADELVSANHDDQRFKALLADLRARRLSKPDVTAVANKFLGVEPTRTYASSAAALQRMEDRHFHDATSASRERAINRINH